MSEIQGEIPDVVATGTTLVAKGATAAEADPSLEAIKLALHLGYLSTASKDGLHLKQKWKSGTRILPEVTPRGRIKAENLSKGSVKTQGSVQSIGSVGSARGSKTGSALTPRSAAQVPEQVAATRDQKLLRMRSSLLAPVLSPRYHNTAWSPRYSNTTSAIVPPEPPHIVTRRKDHTLESYMFNQMGSKPDGLIPHVQMADFDPSSLDRVPRLIGGDALRTNLRLSVRDRAGTSYLSHTMGSGMIPLLKSLGCRPKTPNKAPGGDLAKILDTDMLSTEKVPDAAPPSRHCNLEPVGPPHLQHAIPALCGSSEKDWWAHPGLLRTVDDRALQVLCQHLIFCDVWSRAVMVLCNLAFLVEKTWRFGYTSVLRELKEAKAGLRFEKKKFVDFRSWQDMYTAWTEQVEEYLSFWEQNSEMLAKDPKQAFALASTLDGGTTVLKDLRHKMSLMSNAASSILATASVTSAADALKLSLLLSDLSACLRDYGVPPADASGDEERAIKHGERLLSDWHERVPDGGDDAVIRSVISPLLRPPQAQPPVAAKNGGVKIPAWYTTVREQSEGALEFRRLMKALNVSEGALAAAAGGPRRQACVYVSSTGASGVEPERKALLNMVLPAARFALNAVNIDLSWRDLRGEPPHGVENGANIENSISKHLGNGGMAACTCMLVLCPSMGIKQTVPPMVRKTIIGAAPPAPVKTDAVLDRFKTAIAKLFDTIFDAWAFFDINGDWDVSSQEFMRMCKYLHFTDEEITSTISAIDKDGYGAIDPHEFMNSCTWHEIADGGNFEANEKALMRSKLRRKRIFLEVQERVRNEMKDARKQAAINAKAAKQGPPLPIKGSGAGARGTVIQSKGRWTDKRLAGEVVREAAVEHAWLGEGGGSAAMDRGGSTLQDLEVEMGHTRKGVKAKKFLVRVTQDELANSLFDPAWIPGGVGGEMIDPIPEAGSFKCYSLSGEGAVQKGMGSFCRDAYEAVVGMALGEGGVLLSGQSGEIGEIESQRERVRLVLTARSVRIAAAEMDKGAWAGHGLDVEVSPRLRTEQSTVPGRSCGESSQVRGATGSSRHTASTTGGGKMGLEDYAEKMRQWTCIRSKGRKLAVGLVASSEGGEQVVTESLCLLLDSLLHHEEASNHPPDIIKISEEDGDQDGDVASPGGGLDKSQPGSLERSLGDPGSLDGVPLTEASPSNVPGEDEVALGVLGKASNQSFQGEAPPGVPSSLHEKGPYTRQSSAASLLSRGGGSYANSSYVPQKICWFVRRTDSCVADVVPQLLTQLSGGATSGRRSASGGAPLEDVAKALCLAGKRGNYNTVCVMVGLTGGEAGRVVAGAARHAEQEARKAAVHGVPPTATTEGMRTTAEHTGQKRSTGGGVHIIVGNPHGEAGGLWERAVVFPEPPPLPLGERMALFEISLTPALAKGLHPTQARAMCMRGDAAAPEYLRASAAYLTEMARYMSVKDAALGVDGRLDDLYSSCVLPLLEKLHGADTVKLAFSVLLQTAVGVAEPELGVLLSSRSGEPLPTNLLYPLCARMRPFLTACGAWIPENRLAIRSASLAGAVMRRYKMAALVPDSPSLAFTVAGGLVQKEGGGAVGDIDAVCGVIKGVALRAISQAAAVRKGFKPPPLLMRGPSGGVADGGDANAVALAVVEEDSSSDDEEEVHVAPEEVKGASPEPEVSVIRMGDMTFSVEELFAPTPISDPGDGGWSPEPHEYVPALDAKAHVLKRIHNIEPPVVKEGREEFLSSRTKVQMMSGQRRRSSMKVPTLPEGVSALEYLAKAFPDEDKLTDVETRLKQEGRVVMMDEADHKPNVEGGELLALEQAASQVKGVQRLVEITDGISMDRDHMFERLQASIVLPKERQHLKELEAQAEFAASQHNDVALLKTKADIKAWHVKFKAIETTFKGALSDDIWVVRSACDFEVNARTENLPCGTYQALWHLLFEDDMDFNDITAELVCSPPDSAGPFQPKVLSRAMQERCKTGKWSHVVVCERFFVGKEGTSLVSRLVSQGHWVGGLKIDRFVLVPLHQAPQNSRS